MVRPAGSDGEPVISTKVVPRFDGTEDGYWWLIQLDRYFEANTWLCEGRKVGWVTAFGLCGNAFTWWLSWKKGKQDVTWQNFERAFIMKFIPDLWEMMDPAEVEEEENHDYVLNKTAESNSMPKGAENQSVLDVMNNTGEITSCNELRPRLTPQSEKIAEMVTEKKEVNEVQRGKNQVFVFKPPLSPEPTDLGSPIKTLLEPKPPELLPLELSPSDSRYSDQLTTTHPRGEPPPKPSDGSILVGGICETILPQSEYSIIVHRVITMKSLQNELERVRVIEDPTRMKEGDIRANLSFCKLGQDLNIMGLVQLDEVISLLGPIAMGCNQGKSYRIYTKRHITQKPVYLDSNPLLRQSKPPPLPILHVKNVKWLTPSLDLTSEMLFLMGVHIIKIKNGYVCCFSHLQNAELVTKQREGSTSAKQYFPQSIAPNINHEGSGMSSLIFTNGLQRSLGKELVEFLGRGASWVLKLKISKKEKQKTYVATRTRAISRYESSKSVHVATRKTLDNFGQSANDVPLELDEHEPEFLLLINVESPFMEKSLIAADHTPKRVKTDKNMLSYNILRIKSLTNILLDIEKEIQALGVELVLIDSILAASRKETSTPTDCALIKPSRHHMFGNVALAVCYVLGIHRFAMELDGYDQGLVTSTRSIIVVNYMVPKPILVSIDPLQVLEAIKRILGCIYPLVSRILSYMGPVLNKSIERNDGFTRGPLGLAIMSLYYVVPIRQWDPGEFNFPMAATTCDYCWNGLLNFVFDRGKFDGCKFQPWGQGCFEGVGIDRDPSMS
ncbi:uncharacterized protein LOC131653932 [Vicia villosa]|uniref:uncharacterized protein LOC131653932 n=1 Tax=Vicia villosa TaxID=3911 RepID=UPI00273B3D4E|nr:uncharacterized protein LOC131653932 [Vicia villosa]